MLIYKLTDTLDILNIYILILDIIYIYIKQVYIYIYNLLTKIKDNKIQKI